MHIQYEEEQSRKLSFQELQLKKLYKITQTNNPVILNKICIAVSTYAGLCQLHVFHNSKTTTDVFIPDNTMQFSELKSGERVVLIQE